MRKCLLLMLILSFGVISTSQAQRYRTPEEAYQAVLREIEEARETGATEFTLGAYGLRELPPEIGELTLLQSP